MHAYAHRRLLCAARCGRHARRRRRVEVGAGAHSPWHRDWTAPVAARELSARVAARLRRGSCPCPLLVLRACACALSDTWQSDAGGKEAPRNGARRECPPDVVHLARSGQWAVTASEGAPDAACLCSCTYRSCTCLAASHHCRAHRLYAYLVVCVYADATQAVGGRAALAANAAGASGRDVFVEKEHA